MSRSSRPPSDEGFSLLETVVAIGLVGIVMASAIVFFVGSQVSLRRQADLQAAVQIAAGSMDYVSQLTGKNVLLGRTKSLVDEQVKDMVPGVEVYFDKDQHITKLAYENPADATSSDLKPLSTKGETVLVSSIATPYERSYYVGRCWQKKNGGLCDAPDSPPSDAVPMYRVVVAVTWPSPQCPAGKCHYVAAMLTEVDTVDLTWK
ncbi:type II secretion system protein [Actinoplanes sp. NPDC049548]|uniref:type II secretion system protein n=1 Tax=Actinoplanes sp. NPDC049548 TaxID=3155152 RepID=UPI003428DC65